MPLSSVKIGVIVGSVLLVCAITVTTVLLVHRKKCPSGTAGPSCSFSDEITCSAQGVAQDDGTCVCTHGQCGSDCGEPCENDRSSG
jgi:hypothetical protein